MYPIYSEDFETEQSKPLPGVLECPGALIGSAIVPSKWVNTTFLLTVFRDKVAKCKFSEELISMSVMVREALFLVLWSQGHSLAS